MSVLAIVSDLHFGTVPPGLAEMLLDDITRQRPDAVIVAGDLTQRARRHEFTEAAAFLSRLPGELLVLPGNHDIPAYHLFNRSIRPFGRYRRYIGETGIQRCQLEDCLVVGINTTARAQARLKWQEGWLRRSRIHQAGAMLEAAPPGLKRIVVTHHPLVDVPSVPRAIPVRRAKEAVRVFQEAGIDMLVSGHTHLPFRLEVPANKTIRKHNPLLVIGTPSALSSRLRGEPNGYWVVRVQDAGDRSIQAELRTLSGDGFAAATPVPL